MSLTVKFTLFRLLGSLSVLLLASCHVSQKWAQQSPSTSFPMSHAQARSTVGPGNPYQQSAAAAAVARVQSWNPFQSKQSPQTQPVSPNQWQVPVANYRSAVQTTAMRSADRPAQASYPTQTYVTPERGRVTLVNGRAIAPPDAPHAVRMAVEAGNRLQKMPYKWGGGHARLNDTGYDCSGAVSYVLREAGLMQDQMISQGFFTYGESGEGDWITVWSKKGHVFMTIGGLRFDTGGSTTRTGPRWKTKKRSYKNFLARHPRGL